jgi:hypothetical protein
MHVAAHRGTESTQRSIALAKKPLTAYVLACALALVVAVTALAPASAWATVNPELSGSVSNAEALSGVVAVAVAGHYAYVPGYYAGKVTAIDIANPAAPVIAGSSEERNELLDATTINIAGGYAYVVSKNRNGTEASKSNDDGTGNSLTILNIASNPAEPKIVGSIREASTLFGAYGVAMSGNFAYVASQGCLHGQPCPVPTVGNSFAVLGVSDPASPSIVGSIHNSSLPAPWQGTEALAHATAVAVSGEYAYVTAAYSDRLTVVDIANPSSPRIVASLNDTKNLNFPVDVAVSGHYAYVADQITTGRLTVVDISNPAEPQVVASLANASLDGAYRIRVRGDFAYVSASSGEDVAVVDISNPLSPRLAATLASSSDLHFTTGLDLEASGTHLVASSPQLPGQKQALYPPFSLEEGGPIMTGTISDITLDPEPIEAAITPESEPANPTSQTSASFAFSVNDAVSAVQCRLDEGPWAQCTTPTSQSYTALSEGPHSFQVQATDSAGNTNTATYTWTIAATTNTPPPSTGGGSSGGGGYSVVGTSPETPPSTAQIRAMLLAALVPGGKTSRIASVRKQRGYKVTFDAPARGTVAIYWYAVPKGAHVAGAKPVLVASGRAYVTAKGVIKLTVTLTARGRSMLANARHIELTAKGVFTPAGGPAVTAIKPFTLH